MRRFHSHKCTLALCAALILGLSACFSPTPKGPNPLREAHTLPPASFAIQNESVKSITACFKKAGGNSLKRL